MRADRRAHAERRKRHWHRRFAVVSIALIGWFALSGLVLNHAADFSLADRPLAPSLVRAFYGASIPEGLSGEYIDGQWITVIDGVLYVGVQQAGACAGGLRGAVAVDRLYVMACDDALHVVEPGGAPVERIDRAWGLAGTVTAMGPGSNGGIVVATTGGSACLDAALTALTPCDATPGKTWTQRLPDDARTALAVALGEQQVDIERFVHDLHSGRLFGAGARWAWDLFALALLALAASGALMLRRR